MTDDSTLHRASHPRPSRAIPPARERIELTAHSLVVKYGRKIVLDEISFDWMGGALGVTGSNGSGKSTLLGALIGSTRITGGEVLLSRGDRALSRAELTIGFVPQSFQLAGGMTIRDFVEYAAWIQRIRRPVERARQSIADVGLERDERTRLGHASGGMVRRAGLAAALVGSPDLLVLDEPTTGIDPEQRSMIRALLAEQSLRRTVVFSSHIAEDLEQVCQSVVILDAGTVAFFGSPDEAKKAAQTPSFETAIVALPKLHRESR